MPFVPVALRPRSLASRLASWWFYRQHLRTLAWHFYGVRTRWWWSERRIRAACADRLAPYQVAARRRARGES